MTGLGWLRWAWVACVAAGCSPGSGVGGSGTGTDSATGSGSSTSGVSMTGAGPGTTGTRTTGGSGDASAGVTGNPGTSGSGSGSGGSSGSTGSPVQCPPSALEPGDHADLQLDFGDGTRTFDVHVPPSYDGTAPVPLLLNLHGFGSYPSQQADFSGMNPSADDRGVVVVYPAGLDDSWNAGACCGTSATNGVDDVGFLRAVVTEVESMLCIDPSRVYVTGMSNGGFMAHRLACEAADVFAAAAPVAGVLGIDPADCNPSRPIPVLHVHGDGDLIVPYDGSIVLGFASVPDTFAGWTMRDGCTDDPQITFMRSDITCQTHEACDAGVEVTLCTIANGGHCWPGQPFCPFGTTTTAYGNNDILDFLLGFTLP